MQGEIERDGWQSYLNDFSKRNAGRAARLEVISEELGTQSEVELLPLEGITFESKGSLAASVEIMLGGASAADMRHLTHTVTQVRRIFPKLGADGREDALEIEAEDGAKTILIFETLAALPETTS
jgi:hypothetical protein